MICRGRNDIEDRRLDRLYGRLVLGHGGRDERGGEAEGQNDGCQKFSATVAHRIT